MIKVEHLSKTYRTDSSETHAIKDVSFDVSDGEIFGIIGMSGAGKTTLLRCLSQLEIPDEGNIFIDGEDILYINTEKSRLMKQQIGIVFQSYNLLMQKNVIDNVAFPLLIRMKDKKKIYDRANELIHLVGLDGKQKSYPSKLSGGQKQRIAIARALAANPKLLLLDEPTSALDSITTKQIINILKKINREYNMTILIITHEIGVVKSLCQKVAVIDQGVIVEKGPVNEVFDNPRADITKLLLGRETRED